MNSFMQNIMKNFRITDEEYQQLATKFEKLCHYEAWQLIKMNAKNNCADDQQDVVQRLRIALLRAGSYTKRQVYIEGCLKALKKHIHDPFNRRILSQLLKLWKNRKRHGANRQKFGEHQEVILNKLVEMYVPKHKRPSKERPLEIDAEFSRYCKQITWNELRLIGKQITRERPLRAGMASLSEFDYLAVAL